MENVPEEIARLIDELNDSHTYTVLPPTVMYGGGGSIEIVSTQFFILPLAKILASWIAKHSYSFFFIMTPHEERITVNIRRVDEYGSAIKRVPFDTAFAARQPQPWQDILAMLKFREAPDSYTPTMSQDRGTLTITFDNISVLDGDFSMQLINDPRIAGVELTTVEYNTEHRCLKPCKPRLSIFMTTKMRLTLGVEPNLGSPGEPPAKQQQQRRVVQANDISS